MKYLFLLVFVILLGASVWLSTQMPEGSTDRKALIYWTTDANPARVEQVRLFDEWQVERGLIDDEGVPLIELRLDVGNSDETKKIIQSVSGVAADVLDLGNGHGMRFFQELAVLEDVTDLAGPLGFDVSTSYDSMLNELSFVDFDGDRRQYMYPCNVAFTMIMINEQTFRDVGMTPPSDGWTIEEFEEVGKEFVSRANSGEYDLDNIGGRRFFLDGLGTLELYRSMGVDTYNETATATNLTSPEVVRAQELIRKWTYEDRILPSGADQLAMSSSGGYGGGGAEGFEIGRYATFNGGRWHMIRFRQTNQTRVAAGGKPLELSVVQLPNGGYPTVTIGTRGAVIYRDGSKTTEPVTFKSVEGDSVEVPADTPWAVFFQSFLASKQYNDQIIADSDGLPPNEKYTNSEAYLFPAKDPAMGVYPETEHKVHGPYLEAATTIADPRSYSPFILYQEALREEGNARDKFLANPPIPGYEDAAVAMADADRRIMQRMRETIAEQPELRAEYESRLKDQQTIDQLKASGQKIPAELIRNPFYLRYYRQKGMLDESNIEAAGVRIVAAVPLSDGEPVEESDLMAEGANADVVERMVERELSDSDVTPGISAVQPAEPEPATMPKSAVEPEAVVPDAAESEAVEQQPTTKPVAPAAAPAPARGPVSSPATRPVVLQEQSELRRPATQPATRAATRNAA